MDPTLILALIALIFGILILWNRAYTGLLVGIFFVLFGILGLWGQFGGSLGH